VNIQFRRISLVQLPEASRRTGGTRRVYEALRDQIRAGIYLAGDRLPSSRALAEELGISRTTVTAAFDQLISEGYVLSRQGAANVVAGRAGADLYDAAETPEIPGPPLSGYARRLLGLPMNIAPVRPDVTHDFRYGDLAASDFPTLLWRRAMSSALLKHRDRLTYAHPAGSPALRDELQTYLWRARGIRCDADQIVVVSGSQQGLDLCARLLVDPDDRVVLENPCYAMARNAFAAVGAQLHPVSCDAHGLVPSGLPVAGKVSIAYVTPSHQYPLGGVLSAGRRDQLLHWADEVGAYIIEDDYDGEYRYDVKPIPPLYRSAHGRVIYLGTVSKTLSPTLRLGYLVLPKPLVEAFVKCKQLVDRHCPTFDQEALAEILGTGAYERHVRKMRRRNSERRDALVSALQDSFGDRVEIAGAMAGLHVVAWFNAVANDKEPQLVENALRQGVGVYPVTPLYVTDKPDRAGLVIGFASLSPVELRQGVRRLAVALGV
jgi:GntR family transcriptional regulator/MocR family aminotransferase